MTEFQVKLLRLLTVGLTLIGGLGLSAVGYRFHLPFADTGLIVAVICTFYLAGLLVVGLVRWQYNLLKPLPWDQLATPVCAPLDASRSS